jgi:hypothetical protein
VLQEAQLTPAHLVPEELLILCSPVCRLVNSGWFARSEVIWMLPCSHAWAHMVLAASGSASAWHVGLWLVQLCLSLLLSSVERPKTATQTVLLHVVRSSKHTSLQWVIVTSGAAHHAWACHRRGCFSCRCCVLNFCCHYCMFCRMFCRLAGCVSSPQALLFIMHGPA